jgi:hypothetical protein
MRADIHDGQELCSARGRIDERKTNLTIAKASCSAWPAIHWVRLGHSVRQCAGHLVAALRNSETFRKVPLPDLHIPDPIALLTSGTTNILLIELAVHRVEQDNSLSGKVVAVDELPDGRSRTVAPDWRPSEIRLKLAR